jgi:hypothetical protein
MSMQTDDMLIEAIKSSVIFQEQEKEFILTRMGRFDHLDKFKLKRYLLVNDEKTVRETYRVIRDKLQREEKEKEYLSQTSSNNAQVNQVKNIFDKYAPKIDRPQSPISNSLLSDIEFLGHEIPMAPQVRGQPFKNIDYFTNLDQLCLLESSHVTFSLDDNVPIIIQKFLNKLTTLFDEIDDIMIKRSYFRLFMRSALFNNYLNTGITALRHTEIQPRKIVLNLIYQTDPIYMNANQFEYTSTISHHLKQLVDI